MAVGDKLGKVFGAIGSGLSFIPGPWSALGVAFSAAGTAAGAVDQAKQKREAREDQNTPPATQESSVSVDNQRPAEGQPMGSPPAMAGPQSAKVFGQGNPGYNLGHMGENMDNSVMQMLIKESGGWYDG